MNCPCCNTELEHTGNHCEECNYDWDPKQPAQLIFIKPDRPSTFDVGRDKENRECVVAVHYGINFSITHFLYWANSPVRLINETRELISKSRLPYTCYDNHWVAVNELQVLSKKFQGNFPSYLVLEKDHDGGLFVTRVVQRY